MLIDSNTQKKSSAMFWIFSMISLPNWFVICWLFSPCGPCDGVVLKAFFQRAADEEGRFLPHKAKLNNKVKISNSVVHSLLLPVHWAQV